MACTMHARIASAPVLHHASARLISPKTRCASAAMRAGDSFGGFTHELQRVCHPQNARRGQTWIYANLHAVPARYAGIGMNNSPKKGPSPAWRFDHWIVDGVGYPTVNRITSICKDRGFLEANQSMISARLHRGASTWAELCAPLVNSSASRGNGKKRQRDEMAAILAAYDARKAGA
jgi:hypothetical protein